MTEISKRCTQIGCDWYQETLKGGPVCGLPPGKDCPCDVTKPGNQKVKDYHNKRRDKYKKSK
jgi:hypothetical protein